MIHMPTAFLIISFISFSHFLTNVFIWKFAGKQKFFLAWTLALGLWTLSFFAGLAGGSYDLWIPITFFHIIWLSMIRSIPRLFSGKPLFPLSYRTGVLVFLGLIILELAGTTYTVRGSLLSGLSAWYLFRAGADFLRNTSKENWQQRLCGALFLVHSLMWILRIGLLILNLAITGITGQNTANTFHFLVLAMVTTVLNVCLILLALERNLNAETQLETRGTLALFESIGVGLINQTNTTISQLISEAHEICADSGEQGFSTGNLETLGQTLEKATTLNEYRNALLNPRFFELQPVVEMDLLRQLETLLSNKQQIIHLTSTSSSNLHAHMVPVKLLVTILAFLIELLDKNGKSSPSQEFQSPNLTISLDLDTSIRDTLTIRIQVDQDLRRLSQQFLTLADNVIPDFSDPAEPWLEVHFAKDRGILCLRIAYF